MSDKFHPIPLDVLVAAALREIRHERFFGLPAGLFFRPSPGDPFRMQRYGRELDTPLGVAAGPHTQMALNIVSAWLCGARYIELKTIQTLDELEVAKPCIDMQDEGYNCEWSQELKVGDSFREYFNAWILIRILQRELGFTGETGTLFNMSAGYDLAGIMQDNVQEFFRRMGDCSMELSEARRLLRGIYPAVDDLQIPASISDHITLSTMHGCPPGEIEKIGLYLIREKKLHTIIKLNPTLLGPEALRNILNGTLGFSTEVPDAAFDHDLRYPDALQIIASLGEAARGEGLHFSIKLTNTLESINHKNIFPASEKMMYMSGRALHPVSVALARKLQRDLGGTADISFSAGADCFNVADVIACGLRPVTVCSDLLKPGGYGRLAQYVDNLRTAFSAVKAFSIEDFIAGTAGEGPSDPAVAAMENLDRYADRVLDNPAYRRGSLHEPSIKTSRELGWFDCIHAPCTDTCPTHQDIPRYLAQAAAGEYAGAFNTIFETNPFPSVTGMVCDHTCQLKCTRINYDEPLRIREVKRFIAETPFLSPETGRTVGRGRCAIIGAGPAGLSCAWFLRKAGWDVDVFEQKVLAGGMVSAAIPAFRLTSEAIERDIRRILDAGVSLRDNHRVDREEAARLLNEYDAVFLAAGAQKSEKLTIPGADAEGVPDPLDFLFTVKQGGKTTAGRHVVIIGGGNTAMDAARTAFRLVGKEGAVTVVYRRTIREMPADRGEIEAVKQEGVTIIELASPVQILSENGRVTGLACERNVLAMQGKDGRAIPVKVPGSRFTIPCDTVIPAIGQTLDIDFFDPAGLKTQPGSYRTRIPKLFIGGDALRGASTAINAIADGRKAAAEIAPTPDPSPRGGGGGGGGDLLLRKATRKMAIHPEETDPGNRRNFDLVMSTLTEEQVREEAARCLECDRLCDVCVSVCPNLANFSYRTATATYLLQKAVLGPEGIVGLEEDEEFTVGQPNQVLNIRDLCNECGNCTTFCPSSGRPFADKPGLCLSASTLKDEDCGFLCSELPGRTVLVYKDRENIRTLTLADDQYIYETNQVRAIIRKEDFRLVDVKFLTPCVREMHFRFAAEMSIVMQGALQVSLRKS